MLDARHKLGAIRRVGQEESGVCELAVLRPEDHVKLSRDLGYDRPVTELGKDTTLGCDHRYEQGCRQVSRACVQHKRTRGNLLGTGLEPPMKRILRNLADLSAT